MRSRWPARLQQSGGPVGDFRFALTSPSERNGLHARRRPLALGSRRPFEEEMAMQPHIQNTEFGSITVDGEETRPRHLIRLSGKVKKRKKKLSKEKR